MSSRVLKELSGLSSGVKAVRSLRVPLDQTLLFDALEDSRETDVVVLREGGVSSSTSAISVEFMAVVASGFATVNGF